MTEFGIRGQAPNSERILGPVPEFPVPEFRQDLLAAVKNEEKTQWMVHKT